MNKVLWAVEFEVTDDIWMFEAAFNTREEAREFSRIDNGGRRQRIVKYVRAK